MQLSICFAYDYILLQECKYTFPQFFLNLTMPSPLHKYAIGRSAVNAPLFYRLPNSTTSRSHNALVITPQRPKWYSQCRSRPRTTASCRANSKLNTRYHNCDSVDNRSDMWHISSTVPTFDNRELSKLSANLGAQYALHSTHGERSPHSEHDPVAISELVEGDRGVGCACNSLYHRMLGFDCNHPSLFDHARCRIHWSLFSGLGCYSVFVVGTLGE
jgi:hypothetical protein